MSHQFSKIDAVSVYHSQINASNMKLSQSFLECFAGGHYKDTHLKVISYSMVRAKLNKNENLVDNT